MHNSLHGPHHQLVLNIGIPASSLPHITALAEASALTSLTTATPTPLLHCAWELTLLATAKQFFKARFSIDTTDILGQDSSC